MDALLYLKINYFFKLNLDSPEQRPTFAFGNIKLISPLLKLLI